MSQIDTVVGPIMVEVADGRIAALRFGRRAGSTAPDPLTAEALAQLAAWFEGRLTRFDLPLAPAATPRGAVLRSAMLDIGYGTTTSYGALARTAGSSPRAIGQACARNPLPILIPCHRVLAAGGALGYYSGGTGAPTKRWLLAHERRHGGAIDEGEFTWAT